jgi:bifunctional DNase/RNase
MLIAMTIKGLMVDPVTNTPIVLLAEDGGDRVLPIWVGVFEANAIALQIENVSSPRPMTHDLMRELLLALDGTLERVVISDLRESTFFATLHVSANGKTTIIDARPSDAIALALRARASIFVTDEVIEQARQSDITPKVADQDRIQKWLENIDPDELGKWKM